jgi:surface protein
MFNTCYALTEVPFFDTRAVTTMNGMFVSCRSLRTIPPFNVGLVTNVASMFFNCFALEAIPSLNLGSGVTTFSSFAQNCQSLETVGTISLTGPTSSTGLNNIFTSCTSLSRLGGTNARFTHTIANCKLSATELNNYYTNLPTVTGQTLTVSGNWGVATDNISIATAKGWTISG